MKVIIAGGGWSGCAASLCAHKYGAEVILVERTDMFSGSVYFERMKQRGLYSTDSNEIEKRVDQAGMLGIFSK